MSVCICEVQPSTVTEASANKSSSLAALWKTQPEVLGSWLFCRGDIWYLFDRMRRLWEGLRQVLQLMDILFFWLQHLCFDVFLSFNYRKRLLHLLNWGPLSEHLSESFPVGGILEPNWIALRVTPCRLGHALACICAPWTFYVHYARAKRWDPNKAGNNRLTRSSCVQMCAMTSRDWCLYVCA